MTINEEITNLRKRYGLRKWLVADILGISNSEYLAIENGKLEPPQDVVNKLNKIYNTNIQECYEYWWMSELIDFYISSNLFTRETIYNLLYNLLTRKSY